MRSPFEIFRKNQKQLMVVLIGLAMFAFIILDSLTQMDEPDNMSLLQELAGIDGARKIKEGHFPKRFDLA